MPNRPQQANTGLVLAILALLLVVVIVGLGWFLWPEPYAIPTQDLAEEEDTPRQRADPGLLELDPEPEPDIGTDPGVEPDPEPEIERGPVVLSAMTPFRALVAEADHALALRDAQSPQPDELWRRYSTLEQLDSRFAPYANLRYKGIETAKDRAHFNSDVTRSFERPDVASTAYIIEATPRVAIWRRGGAELPKGESEPPPEVNIPLTRRLQEDINLDVVARWLEAIEGEYGETEYGRHVPLDLVVFEDLNRYLDFSRQRLGLDVPKWSAGFYSSRWDVVCMPVLESTSLAEVIRHEMFHAVQADKAPQSLVVPWFAEGTAEWLDKAPPEGGLKTHPVFAAGAYGYLRSLIAGGYELKLLEFLQQDMKTFYQSPELNYLLAYCFVDFCREEEDLRAVYFDYWGLMCEGVSAENAFARTFGGLDFEALQRRFLKRIQGFPRVTTPPRFSHDAPAEHFDQVPSELKGGVAPPTREGEIASGWYEVLGELEKRGFDTSRAGFLKGEYDALVVAIDSSESMKRPITTEGFDFEALSVWLYSLRYAGTLQFNRKTDGGAQSEEIPPQVILSLVDAVVTDRLEEFVAATGIGVNEDIQKQIKNGYRNFDLTAENLKIVPKRDIARHTAESVAWYWGTRQDSADVTVVDFNIEVQTERENNAFNTRRFNSVTSPLARLFKKTEVNAAPFGSDGADCDWWAGLQGVVNAGMDAGAGRVACMFFTDGPNSLGFYGHVEGGRDEFNYMQDQKKLAEALKIEWDNAGLGNQAQPSILQIFALPGAEGQGLDYIPQQVPQARLDEWASHFTD